MLASLDTTAASESYAATLTDGRRVGIRPATGADRSAIATFFASLGPDSLYWRFFSPRPRLTRRLIDQLTAVRPGRVSLVAGPAEAPEAVTALAGYVYVPTAGSCEVSVAVADAWQKAGLGTMLVLLLVRHAAAQGYRRFHGEVLGGNARMLGLLRQIAPPSSSRVEEGVVRVDWEIPDATARTVLH
jgi:RimJ/RimL family protein N-acetyltransferase